MKKIINWKLFFLLVAVCAVAGLMVLPFTFALAPLPENAPMQIIIPAQIAQTLVLSALASFFGLLLSRRIGFGAPILEGITGGEKRKDYLRSILGLSVLWGILGGVLVVLLCIPFWNMSVELMKAEMAVPVWKSTLAIFYGGTAEEILFRLFLMTLLVWITCKIKKAKDGGPTKIGVWLAIIITGVIFGLGHLGITGAMTAVTGNVILRAVLLNGSLSVIYGWLYWKKGLESAMIAHFFTDIVLHILIPHVIAPLFM
ncbi:CPBP family intramembrane glutamic endopeptidase [Bacillus cereus]|uniref:CPBP family intramembrane glutamic endopeptidase n=1 Tax=Bacillus cereus TaxID=1396 RepID=UPI0020B8CBF4|nr:CPBP family intramembrane glutamic endopeptidase [Bacillus cereus]